MLEVSSTGTIGTTEGKGFKIGCGFPVAPNETTVEAYERFKNKCKSDKKVRKLLGPDCDSWPILKREWKIPALPDNELLSLAIEAWQIVGKTISIIVTNIGGEALDLSFSCGHNPEVVKVVEFSQADFFKTVDGININGN